MVIRRKKIWSLTYADDAVFMATSEEELKDVLKRFTRYLERKKVMLSAEKSKSTTFEKDGGRRKTRNV